MTTGRLSGMRAWLIQRLSAAYLVLYLTVVIAFFLVTPLSGHEAWLALARQPVLAVGGVLFFAALFMHAWVGMRDIILDYVRPLGLRLSALVLTAGWLAALAVWTARIFIRSML